MILYCRLFRVVTWGNCVGTDGIQYELAAAGRRRMRGKRTGGHERCDLSTVRVQQSDVSWGGCKDKCYVISDDARFDWKLTRRNDGMALSASSYVNQCLHRQPGGLWPDDHAVLYLGSPGRHLVAPGLAFRTWVHLVKQLSEGWVLGAFFCAFNSFAQGQSSRIARCRLLNSKWWW